MIKVVVAASTLLFGIGSALADTAVPSWMTVDAAKKTVAVDVVAGWNPDNGALNFNGYYQGDMTVVVPAGWTVKVAFTNHDGMLPHSLLVTKQFPKDDIPPEADNSKVAISKAYTDDPVGGLAPNKKDDFSFVARDPGDYWLFCGVPGHGLQGMYVALKVDPKAETPKVEVASGAAAGRP